MDTALLQIFLMAVIPCVYIVAKTFLMTRAQHIVGWVSGVVAVGGLFTRDLSDSRLPYACMVRFAQFLVLLVVEESFRNMFGRYPAPVFANWTKGQGADAGAMFVSFNGCLGVTLLIMHFAPGNGPTV